MKRSNHSYRRMASRRGPCVALFAFMMLAACGGSPKENYIAQVDEICAGAHERLETTLKISGDSFGSDDDIRKLEDRIVLLKDVRGKIRTLETPPVDRALLDEWFRKIDQFTGYMEMTRSDFRQYTKPYQQTQLALSVAGHDAGAREADEAARRYGFHICGTSKSWQIFPQ